MVKFPRSTLVETYGELDEVKLDVRGSLTDGNRFLGRLVLRFK